MDDIDIDNLDLRDSTVFNKNRKVDVKTKSVTALDNQNKSYTPLVHLHVHTYHSILDGCGSIDDYIKLAKKYNHPAIAITDHGTLSGTFEHYQKCKKAGIKPVLGFEAYVNDKMGDFEEKKYEGGNFHQIILIKNQQGFVNTNKLAYKSFTEGFYKRGRIKTEWLFEHKEGLIITSACIASKVAKLLFDKKRDEAEECFATFVKEFGEDFYAEIQMNELDIQKGYNSFIIGLAKKYKVKIILTNDVHYAFPGDAELQDTLLAINHKSKLDSSFKFNTRSLFYCSSDDFIEFNYKYGYNYPIEFLNYCFKNSLEVAEKCNFDFEMDVEKYPKYEPAQDVIDYFKTSDTKGIISKLAFAKLKQKIAEYKENGIVKIDDAKIKEYVDRLNYELQVIGEKGMLDYFMVNWEIIKDYREHGKDIGPGRGSACGSLLTWVLGITSVDSLRFNLYFERFLNPTRKSLADLDIDYMTDTDHITEEFLLKKYGKDRVLHVSTFSTFNEKGCLKDVVRVHHGEEATGFDSAVAQVTKEMPEWSKVDYTLKDWFEQWPKEKECSPMVKQWLTNPANKKILEQTLRLQGQIRGIGQHAAGVVITPTEHWNYLPTNIITKNKSIVTAFQEADGSGKDLSKLGILKLDMLKLSTLNVIKDTIDLVKKNEGIDIKEKVDNVDLNDPNLYLELKLGLNHGIFQFESPGMNSLIRGTQVDKFDELAANNSLFRPGPMAIGAHVDYIKNKFNPEQIKYIHPVLESILGESNGVLIFQEQVMFIANKIGGMSLGDGDILRRFMDKAGKMIDKESRGEVLSEVEKKSESYQNFQKYWNRFLDGALKNGYQKEIIEQIKNWMIKYLGYSFNKCLTKNHKVISKTRGKINIGIVQVGEEILGYNPITKQDEYNQVKAIYKNGSKKVYKIRTKGNNELECTLDHKVFCNLGAMNSLKNIIKQDHLVKTTVGFEKINCFEVVGFEDTFDLNIDSEFHNFYANGICVSNSHCVSYSKIACQTLFLKHYYPTEFYTSLLNHPKSGGGKDKEQRWLSVAIASAMSKGIKIMPPSRKSGWNWTQTGDKEISMGFSGINGMGEKAYAELEELMQRAKETLQTIKMSRFFEMPFSAFDKKVFEVCVKAGVFDDWSESREYLINLKNKKRKKQIPGQMAVFDLNSAEFDTMLKSNTFPPTIEDQKRKEFVEVCNFDLTKIEEVAKIKDELFKKSGKVIESILNFAQNDIYFFFVDSFYEKISEKGTPYLEIKVGDGISHTSIRSFPSRKKVENDLYDKIKSNAEVGGVYVSEFVKNAKGFINFKSGAKFKRIK